MVMRSGLQGGKGRSNTAASGPSAFVARDLSDTLTAFCYPLMSEGKQTHKTEDNLLFEGHWIGFSNSRHVDLTRILKNRWLSYSSVSLCSRDDIKTFHYQGIQPDGGRCTRVYSRATPEVGAASAHSQLSSRDPPHADGVSAVFSEHSWVYPQTRPVAGHPLFEVVAASSCVPRSISLWA